MFTLLCTQSRRNKIISKSICCVRLLITLINTCVISRITYSECVWFVLRHPVRVHFTIMTRSLYVTRRVTCFSAAEETKFTTSENDVFIPHWTRRGLNHLSNSQLLLSQMMRSSKKRQDGLEKYQRKIILTVRFQEPDRKDTTHPKPVG